MLTRKEIIPQVNSCKSPECCKQQMCPCSNKRGGEVCSLVTTPGAKNNKEKKRFYWRESAHSWFLPAVGPQKCWCPASTPPGSRGPRSWRRASRAGATPCRVWRGSWKRSERDSTAVIGHTWNISDGLIGREYRKIKVLMFEWLHIEFTRIEKINSFNVWILQLKKQSTVSVCNCAPN